MLNVLFFGNCLVVSKRFHTFAPSKDYFDYPGKFPARGKALSILPKFIIELLMQLYFLFVPNKNLLIFGWVTRNVYFCSCNQ